MGASFLVASTFQSSMHELSGCCDSHSDHLHHCLLSAAFTCLLRISWAIGLVITLSFVWMRRSCFESIFNNFSSPGQPLTTWPWEFRYLSKCPPTVLNINAWSCILHPPNQLCSLSFALCMFLCTSDVVERRAWSPEEILARVRFWFNQISMRWMHKVLKKFVHLVI